MRTTPKGNRAGTLDASALCSPRTQKELQDAVTVEYLFPAIESTGKRGVFGGNVWDAFCDLAREEREDVFAWLDRRVFSRKQVKRLKENRPT